MFSSVRSRFLSLVNTANTSLRNGTYQLKHQAFHSSQYLQNNQGLPNRLWKVGRFNHIAMAVPDLEKAASFYRDVLGATVSESQALPEHGVYTVFVELDNTKIELLYPLGDRSPIQGFLDKNKNGGMHHVCLEVNDIKEAMKDLASHNIRALGKEPKIGAHGKPVIFLHPKDCNGVLVELEQE